MHARLVAVKLRPTQRGANRRSTELAQNPQTVRFRSGRFGSSRSGWQFPCVTYTSNDVCPTATGATKRSIQTATHSTIVPGSGAAVVLTDSRLAALPIRFQRDAIAALPLGDGGLSPHCRSGPTSARDEGPRDAMGQRA